MDRPPTVRTVALDDAPLSADVACRRCGYNLRGLRTDGQCPECAASVALSIHGDLLRYAEPAWILRLARGTRFAFWGRLASIVLAYGASFTLALARAYFLFGGLTQIQWAADVAALLGRLLSYYGFWLITSADPRGMRNTERWTVTKHVRVGVLVLAAWDAGLEFGQAYVPASVPNALFQAASVLVQTYAITVTFAQVLCLERLALRIPQDRLARSAGVLRWGLSAVALLGVIEAVVYAVCNPTIFTPISPTWSFMWVLNGFSCGTAVVTLAATILLLVLLRKLGSALYEQANQAELIGADQTARIGSS